MHSKKNSNSDLQSRLKTRKLLGVGDGNGASRSKISQILGFDENLFLKLPRGLFYWQAANVAYISISGILCIIAPETMAHIEAPFEENCSSMAMRLYGSALTAFAYMFREILMSKDGNKSMICSILISCSVLFGLQCLVQLCAVIGSMRLTAALFYTFCIRIIGAAGNLWFQDQMMKQGGLVRYLFNQMFQCPLASWMLRVCADSAQTNHEIRILPSSPTSRASDGVENAAGEPKNKYE